MSALELKQFRQPNRQPNTAIDVFSIEDSLPMPSPHLGERPSLYADRVGEWYVAQKSAEHKKGYGLYLTPVLTAHFMASKIQVTGENLRILDPAAGGGILACAAIESLVLRPKPPMRIILVAYELDFELIPVLRAVLDYVISWCEIGYAVGLEVQIEARDFILAQAEALRLFGGPIPYQENELNFDAVISNPPYFKIEKSDPRALAAARVVHGQPNIYGLFMAVCAALLKPQGEFIFIVPRSFASGPYFRQFRTVFFDIIRPVEIHVFNSRREAFSRDNVLQENIIFTGHRDDYWHKSDPPSSLSVSVSSSRGVNDLKASKRRYVHMSSVLNLLSADKVLRIPLTKDDDDALILIDSWPNTLKSLGLNISTGPVVPFRATDLVSREGKVPASHVPLLWMNHVKPMAVRWPLEQHKPEYIKRDGAESLLLANKNYVLLRRFSAKEEASRLTAAPYMATDFNALEIGLENHLNYIHRPMGWLHEDEVWGLSALYNSHLLDTYCRVANGNTQVSATELRAMPLPPHEIIIALGRQVKNLSNPFSRIDDLVGQLIYHSVLKELAFN